MMPRNHHQQRPDKIVIAGAGISGLSTAFYLVEKYGVSSTIIDRTGAIAPCASGKAAGFLALDWNDGTPTQTLTRRSFALHQQLADRFGAQNIHYRRVSCLSARIVAPQKQSPKPQKKKKKRKATVSLEAKVDWATTNLMSENSVMGQEDTVAQVHPKLLCQHLWKACESKGCTLIKGKVTGATAHAQGKLEAVALLDENGKPSQMAANSLVYACGPWTANVMYGIKAHSLVLPTRKVFQQCVFFYSDDFGDCEVFVRPDTTAFCSGLIDDMVKVQEVPGQEQVEPAKVHRLREAVRNCSGTMGDLPSSGNENGDDEKKQDTTTPMLGEPIIENACYQPVTNDYLPIIGPLTKRASGCNAGCYMAGGNNCWGILLGPATGECMADLIMTGKTTNVDISKFRPSRYRNLKPVVD